MKFSDGSKLTSEDVKFTIERAKAKNEDSSLQTLKYLEKIETPDDTTVELYFSQTVNQVLNELCQTRPLRIMSTTAVKDEKVKGKFIAAIGSGPFVITKSSTETTEMKPNPYIIGNIQLITA
ncbi:ABC transporter, substrate-binding protein, family 5 domain protein [Streptococcus ictaluri 707-05]|uniref:ABC transporter, substrate-binding protein, family 5 domain protein n=1 Tax=Streptococcus ictaluri 707-05 TaxID=764299 RepID=G5K351_9STRE|nr:ABC transporter, substrate-binding protein, family 5 domain protein [Streptococcus ictaluri 707-05]